MNATASDGLKLINKLINLRDEKVISNEEYEAILKLNASVSVSSSGKTQEQLDTELTFLSEIESINSSLTSNKMDVSSAQAVWLGIFNIYISAVEKMRNDGTYKEFDGSTLMTSSITHAPVQQDQQDQLGQDPQAQQNSQAQTPQPQQQASSSDPFSYISGQKYRKSDLNAAVKQFKLLDGASQIAIFNAHQSAKETKIQSLANIKKTGKKYGVRATCDLTLALTAFGTLINRVGNVVNVGSYVTKFSDNPGAWIEATKANVGKMAEEIKYGLISYETIGTKQIAVVGLALAGTTFFVIRLAVNIARKVKQKADYSKNRKGIETDLNNEEKILGKLNGIVK